MTTIDREQLSKYIQESIKHEENPESFRFQMQHQISKFFKAQQHQLKVAHSKIKIKKLVEDDLLKRKKLQDSLEEKLKRSVEIKAKKMSEYSKSLSDLRKKKENMQTQQVKLKRKKQLLESLKKIQQFQKKKGAVINSRLSQSASQTTLNNISRLKQREQVENAQYDEVVNKLNQRGIFKMSSRVMSDLYTEKAHHKLKQAQLQQKIREDKLVQSLNKIEQARERKEALLAERSKKIEKLQKYQFDLNKNRYREIQLQKIMKRRQLILHQSKKMIQSQSLLIHSQLSSKPKHESQLTNIELQEGYRKEKKGGVYRQNIRKCIDSFIKQQNQV